MFDTIHYEWNLVVNNTMDKNITIDMENVLINGKNGEDLESIRGDYFMAESEVGSGKRSLSRVVYYNESDNDSGWPEIRFDLFVLNNDVKNVIFKSSKSLVLSGK